MKNSIPAKTKDKAAFPGLYNWNVWLAGLHAIQGAVVLLLSKTNLFPVQTGYLTADPVTSELTGVDAVTTATRHLFDINMAYLAAALFFIAAIAHLAAATYFRKQYESDLKKKFNRLRWAEFGLSSGVLLVILSVLAGVVELSVLVAVFVLNIIMGILLLVMDTLNQGKSKLHCLTGIVGFAAGLVPWFILGMYIWGSTVYGGGDIPGYVYGVFATAFVMLSAIGVNAYLQYKKQGKWQDFLYGERMFIVLGFVLKTAVIWQIFAGALRS